MPGVTKQVKSVGTGWELGWTRELLPHHKRAPPLSHSKLLPSGSEEWCGGNSRYPDFLDFFTPFKIQQISNNGKNLTDLTKYSIGLVNLQFWNSDLWCILAYMKKFKILLQSKTCHVCPMSFLSWIGKSSTS